MTETQTDAAAIVDTFFGALLTGDAATCIAQFTEDAVVWHNHDQVAQPIGEALAELAGLGQLNPSFEMIGRDLFDGGLVQRHVIHVPLPNGEKASIPAIQRISVVDGRINRIDEYMDSAQMGGAIAALQAGA